MFPNGSDCQSCISLAGNTGDHGLPEGGHAGWPGGPGWPANPDWLPNALGRVSPVVIGYSPTVNGHSNRLKHQSVSKSPRGNKLIEVGIGSTASMTPTALRSPPRQISRMFNHQLQ